MAKWAALNRLLRRGVNGLSRRGDYNLKVKLNESVKAGDLELNINPSDYEKHRRDFDFFDSLSKAHLIVDTTGNISGFVALWKTKGLRAAVEGLTEKYRFKTAAERDSEKALLLRIDVGVNMLLKHFSVGDPRPPVGSPKTETGKDGKGNGNGDGSGNGNGDGSGNGNANGGNGNENGSNGIINSLDEWVKAAS